MKLSSSPLIASLVEEEETSDGALSSGDALFLGLNIALTNSVNPCAFFSSSSPVHMLVFHPSSIPACFLRCYI